MKFLSTSSIRDRSDTRHQMFKRLLAEGGLVGHLQHLYDNIDLTFGEIKYILRTAASGQLQKVSEKLDGMNLVFSYDESSGTVKVTRGSDIKTGGMDAAALAAKFAGRGSVEEAFTTAFEVLEDAIGALDSRTRKRVFGPNANRWYSIEIIYTKNPNVINYDSNSVVFHGWPVFKRDDSGNTEMAEDDIGGVDILSSKVEQMQNALRRKDWSIRGPALVSMRDMSNGNLYSNAEKRIDAVAYAAGVSDSDTIGTYLSVLLKRDLQATEISESLHSDIIARCIKLPGAPNVNAIKAKASPEDAKNLAQFVKDSTSLLKKHIRPLELAINDFAVELLQGLKSTLVSDTDREVVRLRQETEKAINAIKASGNETAMTMLAAQLEKLKSVSNITSPVEGVVFIYKGNAYKFTGNFAAANQILGLFRYSRI